MQIKSLFREGKKPDMSMIPSQEDRLDYLVKSFKDEAPEYRRVKIPQDT